MISILKRKQVLNVDSLEFHVSSMHISLKYVPVMFTNNKPPFFACHFERSFEFLKKNPKPPKSYDLSQLPVDSLVRMTVADIKKMTNEYGRLFGRSALDSISFHLVSGKSNEFQLCF